MAVVAYLHCFSINNNNNENSIKLEIEPIFENTDY